MIRSLLYVPASSERFVTKAHERGAETADRWRIQWMSSGGATHAVRAKQTRNGGTFGFSFWHW